MDTFRVAKRRHNPKRQNAEKRTVYVWFKGTSNMVAQWLQLFYLCTKFVFAFSSSVFPTCNKKDIASRQCNLVKCIMTFVDRGIHVYISHLHDI